MKTYHSYWSAGYAGKPSSFLIDLHRLSAYLLKKHYGEVHLVTDSVGASVLGSLGYDSVSTELDQIPIEYKNVWSLGKIFTYKKAAKEGIPFLHIDYDVLLWKPLPTELTSSPLFVERIELDIDMRYSVRKFYDACPKLHDLENAKDPDGAINAGILGGHDTDFIGEAYGRAWDFVMDPANRDLMTGPPLPDTPTWSRATISEQLYFYHYARLKNKHLECLLNTFTNREKDKEAHNLGYTHLWGAKSDLDVQFRVLEKCKEFGLPIATTPRDPKWLFQSAAKVAQAMATPETSLAHTRLEICKTCPEWTGVRCKICGCFTKLKVRLEKEKCPLGKW